MNILSMVSASKHGRALVYLLAVVMLMVAFSAGAGVAAADEHPGKSCPGDNPNVGLDNTSDEGETMSLIGIVTAGQAIGCPPLDA